MAALKISAAVVVPATLALSYPQSGLNIANALLSAIALLARGENDS